MLYTASYSVPKSGAIQIKQLVNFINNKSESRNAVVDTHFSVVEEDIAIIGMACRFPRINSPEELWKYIINPGDSETISGGIDGIENFDAELFGVSPKESKIMDPQIRLFLQCVWTMFEDAGYNPFEKSNHVGVFAGCGINTYFLNNLRDLIDADVNLINSMNNLQLLYNNDKDYIATKTSYLFNLTGPSVNVQSACSTSLTALHLACQSLKMGECDYAIAGTSTVILPDDGKYEYSENMVFSKDGNCRAFDENATGTVFRNGIGCVLLKPLKNAIQDSDQIYAVIKGSAINNDGNNKVGFSAPSVSGQTYALERALKVSGLVAEDIEYIEAHGTGTKVGDAIEIKALKNAYKTNKKNYCAIGSLKNDLGHMAWSSGIASLIKVIEIFQNKQIPPMHQFSTENKELNLKDSPFYINTVLRPWETKREYRTAAISAFGLGGTNVHVIVQEYKKKLVGNSEKEWRLLPLSGLHNQNLKSLKVKYMKWLENHQDIDLDAMVYTAGVGRRHLAKRDTILFQTEKELKSLLVESINTPKKSEFEKIKKIVFLFPGNGTIYSSMGRKLYCQQPVFREYINQCDNICTSLGRDSIKALMFDSETYDIEQSQLLIFSIEYALCNFWIQLGIKPDLLLGHSLGEYVVAVISDIMQLKDCFRILIKRGQLMKKCSGNSGMISIQSSVSAIEKILKKMGGNLAISAVNTKNQVVLSGALGEIARLADFLTNEGIRNSVLPISVAGHTYAFEKYLPEFRAVLSEVSFQMPRISAISTVTGLEGIEQMCNSEYWCQHLVKPVLFENAIQYFKDDKNTLFLEMGTTSVLLNFVMEELDYNNLFVSSLKKGEDDICQILTSIGQLYSHGFSIDFDKLYKKQIKISLPTYPFTQKKYWIENKFEENLAKDFYVKNYEKKDLVVQTDKCCTKWLILYSLSYAKYAKDICNEMINKLELITEHENVEFKFIQIDNLNMLENNFINREDVNVVYISGDKEFSNCVTITADIIIEKCYALIQKLRHIKNQIHANKLILLSENSEKTDFQITFRNIQDSVLRVFELENRDIFIRSILVDGKSISASVLVCELLYGKDVDVQYKAGMRYSAVIERYDAPLYLSKKRTLEKGIYLFTGGLGGLGRLLIEDFLKKGIQEYVLLNRRELTNEESNWFKLMEEQHNAKFFHIIVNVANYHELEAAIKKICAPIDIVGIFHLAGFISDAIIDKVTYKQLQEVFEPKVLGAWNLHIFSNKECKNLKIFSLFSSATSLLGNAGQVSHASANACLDALAEIRDKKGLPVSCVNWGTWSQIGHLGHRDTIMNRLSAKGFRMITPQFGLRSLDCILSNKLKKVAVLPMDWEKFISFYKLEKHTLYRKITSFNDTILADDLEPDEISDIDSYIELTIEKILGEKTKSRSQSLIKMGLDSLTSIEIRNVFQRDLKLNLDATFVYDNPSVKQISEKIHSLIDVKEDSTENKECGSPSYQQKRWLKLIEKGYGQRVVPIIYETSFDCDIFYSCLKAILERHVSLTWYFPNSNIRKMEIEEILKKNDPLICY